MPSLEGGPERQGDQPAPGPCPQLPFCSRTPAPSHPCPPLHLSSCLQCQPLWSSEILPSPPRSSPGPPHPPGSSQILGPPRSSLVLPQSFSALLGPPRFSASSRPSRPSVGPPRSSSSSPAHSPQPRPPPSSQPSLAPPRGVASELICPHCLLCLTFRGLLERIVIVIVRGGGVSDKKTQTQLQLRGRPVVQGGGFTKGAVRPRLPQPSSLPRSPWGARPGSHP